MFTRYFYKMEEQGRQRTEDMKIELITYSNSHHFQVFVKGYEQKWKRNCLFYWFFTSNYYFLYHSNIVKQCQALNIFSCEKCSKTDFN